MVLGLVGNRSFRDLRKVLRPSGILVLSGGGVSGGGGFLGPLELMARAQLVGLVSRLRVAMPLATPSAEALDELTGLVESGEVAPIVDRTFTFEHARAKVVVTLY